MAVDPNVIYSFLVTLIGVIGIIAAWWKKASVDIGKILEALQELGTVMLAAFQDLKDAYADKNISDDEFAKMLEDYRLMQQKYNDLVASGKAMKADLDQLYNDILNAINGWRAQRKVEKLSMPAMMKMAKGAGPGK